MTASPFMSRAITLAARARHGTSPNPMVGAVIVRNDEVVGVGYHRRAGSPHAEIHALLHAGGLARDATMFVTLEPCAHHGRTGPCAHALIEAGIERVVVAMEDPDPRVRGRGIAQLRAVGVQVEVGDGAEEAEGLNPGWLAARRQGRPYLALKWAATLDGKIATRDGESRWITGDAARAEVHRLRTAYDAIVVGAGTVLKDDPELTARLPSGHLARRQPLRVVVDGRLRVDHDARVLGGDLPGRALVLTTEVALKRRGRRLVERGAWVEPLADSGPIPGRALLDCLSGHGIGSVLVEGGGELAWTMVESRLVDHVYAFVAPTLLGGGRAPSPVDGDGFERLAGALRLETVGIRRLGDDILVEAVAVGGDG
ncbi:MAG: diaminohydroxyphosphoribosylaminopyrimidine deaminase [Chloroflexota bacterium]|nr:diaminohydroxyphosphoribosylaminopyrimidine deaminase [Chloroflexota bacterium]